VDEAQDSLEELNRYSSTVMQYLIPALH
jgi:hypothetical protein